MTTRVPIAPPPIDRVRLPPTVWLFGLASLLNDASSEAIFPLLGLFMTTLGAPMGLVGLALGAADTLAVGIKIAAGRWSDRVRRRPLVIAGYLIATAGRAALVLATSPWHVLGARGLDRAGKGIRSGARDAMLADAVPATERGRAFGVTQAMDHVGAAVGPLMASVCLARGVSLRTAFGLAAGLGLAAPLLLAMKLREIPRQRTATATAQATAKATGTESSEATGGPSGIAPAGSGKNARSLTAYLTVCGIFALANSSDAFILVRATNLGWRAAELPLLWLVHHVVKSVTSAVGGSLSDRVPRVWLIVGGWFAYAGAYAGFAAATRRWHIVALLVFYAAYHGLAEAPERALVADLAGPAQRGRAFGWYHGVVGMAALPAGLLTGWLWDRFGAPAAFGACAGVAALAAAGLGALARYGPLRSAA
jgi:MFS family permease